MIEEQIDFDRAVEAAVDWVNQHSNWGETLLVVTADHETGYLLGPGSGQRLHQLYLPLINHGAGLVPGLAWYSRSHTNQLVPLFAKGAASHHLKHAAKQGMAAGTLDNTAIARTIMPLL